MKKFAISVGILLLSISMINVVELRADTLVSTAVRAGFNDLGNWTGSCFANVASLSSASGNGVDITATGQSGDIRWDQQRFPGCHTSTTDNGWYGNFAQGDGLVWAYNGNAGTGPIELNLSQGVAGIGTQFMADIFGAFVAHMDVYSGATLLGSVTNPAGNSSCGYDQADCMTRTGIYDPTPAIFLGVFDLDGAHITRVVLSVSDCTADCTDFAINQVSLLEGQQVPEPASLFLLGTGLIGLASLKRSKKAS